MINGGVRRTRGMTNYDRGSHRDSCDHHSIWAHGYNADDSAVPTRM